MVMESSMCGMRIFEFGRVLMSAIIGSPKRGLSPVGLTKDSLYSEWDFILDFVPFPEMMSIRVFKVNHLCSFTILLLYVARCIKSTENYLTRNW